jgi:GT2 family glycosyltransferase
MSDTVQSPPVLSIIIVTSMGIRDLVLRCLGSIYERAAPDLPLEVLVVDNASRDGTVQAIREHFPQVRVFENDSNLGFAPANNQALPYAQGRYILYLNPDTEVGEGTLQTCVGELERDSSVGMVGCRLMLADGRIQYEGGRRAQRISHLVWDAVWLHMFFPRHPVFAGAIIGDWDHRGVRDVEAISGAFMMVRRSIAQQLGALPTDLFLYHEDLSFCLRVQQGGHRIVYRGDVEITHYCNQSTKRSRARWDLLEGEVKTLLIRERSGLPAALVARGVFAVRSLVRLGISLFGWLPGMRSFRERYPRQFQTHVHALLLVWCFLPWAVRPLMPRAGVQPKPPPAHLQPAG